MSDDKFWRIVIGAAIVGLLVAFRPQIKRFLDHIGYRDWRKPPKQ